VEHILAEVEGNIVHITDSTFGDACMIITYLVEADIVGMAGEEISSQEEILVQDAFVAHVVAYDHAFDLAYYYACPFDLSFHLCYRYDFGASSYHNSSSCHSSYARAADEEAVILVFVQVHHLHHQIAFFSFCNWYLSHHHRRRLHHHQHLIYHHHLSWHVKTSY